MFISMCVSHIMQKNMHYKLVHVQPINYIDYRSILDSMIYLPRKLSMNHRLSTFIYIGLVLVSYF